MMLCRALFVAAAIAVAAIGAAQTANAETYYKNCDAAREAGVTPLYEGDPGYAPHLDRDGVICS